MRSGKCVTGRTAGTGVIRSPGRAGTFAQQQLPVKGRKKFFQVPRSLENFFAFRCLEVWSNLALPVPAPPLTGNSSCAHGKQPKSPQPISAGRHFLFWVWVNTGKKKLCVADAAMTGGWARGASKQAKVSIAGDREPYSHGVPVP